MKASSIQHHSIDPASFRKSVGGYASGITIITAHDREGPVGFTCQSFYSVSIEPPLVSFSVSTTSGSYPRIREGGIFAVNILSEGQHALSEQFAKKDNNRWAGLAWSRSADGNPVLENTVGWLNCKIMSEHSAGDHIIVVGLVTEVGFPARKSGIPLLYFDGDYRQLRPSREAEQKRRYPAPDTSHRISH